MNLANQLTLLRLLLIPLMIIIFYLPYGWHYSVTSGVFCLAALTDWLDGLIARKYNQTTAFGAFLDPVADKLIVTTALVLLLEIHATPWFTIPTTVIISREIVISALREWMAELGKRSDIAVSMIGKFKTTIQMVAITILLFEDPKEPTWLASIGYGLLYIAVLLTLCSMLVYLKTAWSNLMKH